MAREYHTGDWRAPTLYEQLLDLGARETWDDTENGRPVTRYLVVQRHEDVTVGDNAEMIPTGPGGVTVIVHDDDLPLLETALAEHKHPPVVVPPEELAASLIEDASTLAAVKKILSDYLRGNLAAS